MAGHAIDTEPGVHYLTDEEARAIFDDAARHHMKMSGEEFWRDGAPASSATRTTHTGRT